MEKYMGRNVILKEVFTESKTFQSMYAANKWLKEKGYDSGSSCATMPTAIMKGNYYDYGLPHKWKNFTEKEKRFVHGVMTGDMRDGPVFVYIFE